MRRVLSALVVVALLALIAPQAAQAHAGLLSSDPADGSSLQAAPADVTLEFSEPLLEDTADVSIQSPAGEVLTAAVEAAGATVVIPWPQEAVEGDFSVNFRVVSGDGHPIEGTVAFTIEPAAASDTETAAAASAPAASEPPTAIETTAAVAADDQAAQDEPVNWPFVAVIMLLGIAAFTALLIASRAAREKRRG